MTSVAYNHMFFDKPYNPPAASSSEIKLIKTAALRLLARREYSRLELFRKLSQKFSSGDEIQQVLDQLKEQGYQSDDRFTESFIRAKVRAGNGPFKIKIELREKGICESTALSAFDRQSIDWLVLAKQVHEKRFGGFTLHQNLEDGSFVDDSEEKPLDERSSALDSMKYLTKQIRYLKNKGFYQEHIDQAIKSD